MHTMLRYARFSVSSSLGIKLFYLWHFFLGSTKEQISFCNKLLATKWFSVAPTLFHPLYKVCFLCFSDSYVIAEWLNKQGSDQKSSQCSLKAKYKVMRIASWFWHSAVCLHRLAHLSLCEADVGSAWFPDTDSFSSDPPLTSPSPAASVCCASSSSSSSPSPSPISFVCPFILSLLLFTLFVQASFFSFSASASYRCLRCSGYSSLYRFLDPGFFFFSFRSSLLYSCLTFCFLLKANPWPEKLSQRF